jgi:hypothetical protein
MSASPRPRAAGRGRPPVRERLRRARGQALVELAIVLPVFLVIVGAAIDLGRLFNAYVSIENAAKEGAFYGARNPLCDVPKAGCANPNTVDWHVRNELPGVTIGTPTIECLDAVTGATKALTACVEDDRYRVGVTHQFALLTPLLSPILGSSLTLSSTATSVVLNEAFDPNATPFPMPTNGDPPPPPPPPPPGCASTPAANFSFSVQNKRVTFTDTSSSAAGCTITTWAWQFGDGTTSSEQHPVHQYPSKDTPYAVTLTVTNSFGQNATTQTVTTE